MQRDQQPHAGVIRAEAEREGGAANLPQLLLASVEHLHGCETGLGLPLSRQEFDDAITVLKKLGLIRKGGERDRRPTLEEIDRLMEHFGRIRENRPSSIPMQRIVAFALFSTRRQEEITSLRWDDLDDDRVLVRNIKHPGDKIGNNVYCSSTEALAIVKSMPRVKPEIFPYQPTPSAPHSRALARS